MPSSDFARPAYRAGGHAATERPSRASSGPPCKEWPVGPQSNRLHFISVCVYVFMYVCNIIKSIVWRPGFGRASLQLCSTLRPTSRPELTKKIHLILFRHQRGKASRWELREIRRRPWPEDIFPLHRRHERCPQAGEASRVQAPQVECACRACNN